MTVAITRLELSASDLHEAAAGTHFKRLQPRPYHPKKDAAAQEVF